MNKSELDDLQALVDKFIVDYHGEYGMNKIQALNMVSSMVFTKSCE